MSESNLHSRDEFSWSAHPAAERPGHAIAAAIAVIAVAAAVWFSVDSLAWGGVAIVVLVVSLNRFFFPSRFHIDADGITAGYLLVRKRASWRQLRRFIHDDRGGFLSTRSKASRLDAYRGMHILFGENREHVIRAIKSRMAAAQGDTQSSVAPCMSRTGEVAA